MMKTRKLSPKMVSLISSSADASLNLTTTFVLVALVVSVLALVTASTPDIHVLRPVVSADEIHPKAVEAKPVVKRLVFQDDEYGVRFQYPAAWSIQETTIADLSDDSPIERALSLAPQNWEGIKVPVAVEIGLGSREELGRVWPGLATAQSSTVTPFGYTMLVWQSSSGDVFYAFEHPVASELWVAFRDSAGEEEIVSKMASTFEFTLIHPLVPGLSGMQ
jgi:hypothetical protein